MDFYTVSGELSRHLESVNGFVDWDGTNMNFMPVSTGIYIYVIKSGTTVLLSGKLLVVRD